MRSSPRQRSLSLALATAAIGFLCGFSPGSMNSSIKFDHAKHLAWLSCFDCHSQSASYPEMKICGQCHVQVAADEGPRQCNLCHKDGTNRIVRPLNRFLGGWGAYNIPKFSHRRHAALDPTCTKTCHSGIESVTDSNHRTNPEAACAKCHDDVDHVERYYRGEWRTNHRTCGDCHAGGFSQ